MKHITSSHTIKGDGIKIELDTTQIFPNDPGQGTPILVVRADGGTATWNCATSEGEVDTGPLNDKHLKWLEYVTPCVETWMQANGI